MSDFSAQLSAAKAAPRPIRDVQILLDAGLAEKREQLHEKLELALAIPADDRLTGTSPRDQAVKDIESQIDDLTIEAADSLVTLRFTRLPGDQWAEITARCPARIDSPVDRQYGYNMHGACKLAAPLSGVRVVGDEMFTLEKRPASDGVPAVDEWADLFETISGHEFGLIVDAVYELNEYEPASRVATLKKELATRPA